MYSLLSLVPRLSAQRLLLAKEKAGQRAWERGYSLLSATCIHVLCISNNLVSRILYSLLSLVPRLSAQRLLLAKEKAGQRAWERGYSLLSATCIHVLCISNNLVSRILYSLLSLVPRLSAQRLLLTKTKLGRGPGNEAIVCSQLWPFCMYLSRLGDRTVMF